MNACGAHVLNIKPVQDLDSVVRMVRMRAADAIIETLIESGVTHVFGLPGGQSIPLYDAMYRRKDRIKHILVRHEEQAGFMAYGYAVRSGRVGVCDATAGPGAGHLVNSVATCYHEYIPLIALTMKNRLDVHHKNAAQWLDQLTLFKAITKWNAMLPTAGLAASYMQDAVRIASSPPMGAVQIDLPGDILFAEADFEIPPKERYLPLSNRCLGDPSSIERSAKLLVNAQKPALLAGFGTIMSDSSSEVIELAELLTMPVMTCDKSKGIIPEDHPLAVGPYLADTYAGRTSALRTVEETDVLLAVGTSFSISSPETLNCIKPSTKLIQVDANPAQIGKNKKVEIGIVGDAKAVLSQVVSACKRLANPKKTDLRDSPRVKELDMLRRDWESLIKPKVESDAVPLMPERILREVQKVFLDPYRDTIVSVGGGNHTNWAVLYLNGYEPRTWCVPEHYSGMGTGLTMGLGAQIAAREVIGKKSYAICIEGDGSFGMNLAELATATQFQIPVTVVLMNNEALGMIKDHQRFDPRVGGDRNGQGKRFIGVEFKNPDFARMAEAFHCYGERVEEPQQIRPALENAMKANDKGQTAVLDCMINKDAWWDYNRY